MLYLHHCIRCARLVLAVTLLAGVAACNDSSTNSTSQNTTSADSLTDGSILHIAMTLNQGEVMTNQPGITKATSDSLRQFAQQMVTEHGQTAQLVQTTATNAGITLRSNIISTMLNNSAQGVAAKLNAMSGVAFDTTYIQAQVTMHHQALDMLDFTLIPRAQNAQVKTLLTDMRAAVMMHLTHAQALMRMMTP
jgi:putative membrane protein